MEHLDHPSPPISMMPKWRALLFARLRHCLGGVGGLIVPFYTVQDCNLGQNKWNIWTTPPPHFNDAKMARFALRASSSLLRGGGGLIVPFYTVQDCRIIQVVSIMRFLTRGKQIPFTLVFTCHDVRSCDRGCLNSDLETSDLRPRKRRPRNISPRKLRSRNFKPLEKRLKL